MGSDGSGVGSSTAETPSGIDGCGEEEGSVQGVRKKMTKEPPWRGNDSVEEAFSLVLTESIEVDDSPYPVPLPNVKFLY